MLSKYKTFITKTRHLGCTTLLPLALLIQSIRLLGIFDFYVRLSSACSFGAVAYLDSEEFASP